MKTKRRARGIMFRRRYLARMRLSIILPALYLASCAALLRDSENFYRDMPRRRINWRESLTDCSDDLRASAFGVTWRAA
jgi:hypothetical protein